LETDTIVTVIQMIPQVIHPSIPLYIRYTVVYKDYCSHKTKKLSLTFIDLSYVDVAEVTSYVYYDLLFFLFFVNVFQHHEEFIFQFFHASKARGQILFN